MKDRPRARNYAIVDALTVHVHNIPPELFEVIFDLVFETPNAAKVHIDANYKPPAQLQVSHATRASFANAYYSNTIFTYNQESYIRKFFHNLPRQHLDLICRLHLIGYKIEFKEHARTASTRVVRSTYCHKAIQWIEWKGKHQDKHFQQGACCSDSDASGLGAWSCPNDLAVPDDLDNMDGLAEHIQDLPPELFDMILDFVLTPSQTHPSLIAYKPPVQLQISRSTRATFAARFYPLTTFTVPCKSYDLMAYFCDSLPDTHRLSIKHALALDAGRGGSAVFHAGWTWTFELKREDEMLDGSARFLTLSKEEEEKEKEERHSDT
ncbi:hypothetical protein PRZ48_014152 [Zasmidium cellare]|uniref:F-box domain-containing protein n=1 Tax=Zasmidium cellare TaxID=395010 RepID=A0ABR0E0M8_ZASCE|nr:hypothetical protein PRZ48_014152 [Zasmidium cellare]